MKKSFLYLCMVAMLAAAFSSCLGDNESTTSSSQVFTVIKKSDAGVLYAVIYFGGVAYITGDGLSEAEVSADDAALISYKVNFNNLGGSTIAKADYLIVNERFPATSHKNVEEQPMDTVVNNSPFKSVSLEVADENKIFSNRWLFQFSAEVQGDNQNFDVVFSYDEDSQKNKDGTALPANTAIVDVTLVKTGVATEGATATTKEKSVVVDFTSFRTVISPTTIPSEGVSVKLWFRYIYTNPSTKVKDVNYWQPGVGLNFWNETN